MPGDAVTVGRGLNPELVDVTDDTLIDTLEQQYERGEALNPEFVWELINRDVAVYEAELARLRAALELIAIPPVHVPDVSEGCEGCAGIARAALDGADYTNAPARSIPLDDVGVIVERDRLRAVVAEFQRTYHALDHALDDDSVEGVTVQVHEWNAARDALLDTPTADVKEAT